MSIFIEWPGLSASDRVEASSVLHTSLNCLSLMYIIQSNLTFLLLTELSVVFYLVLALCVHIYKQSSMAFLRVIELKQVVFCTAGVVCLVSNWHFFV